MFEATERRATFSFSRFIAARSSITLSIRAASPKVFRIGPGQRISGAGAHLRGTDGDRHPHPDPARAHGRGPVRGERPPGPAPARRHPAGDARRAPLHRRRHGRDRRADRPRPVHGRVPARPPRLPLARRDHARGRLPRARAADGQPRLHAGRDRVPAAEHRGRLHGPDRGRVLPGGDRPAGLGRDRR